MYTWKRYLWKRDSSHHKETYKRDLWLSPKENYKYIRVDRSGGYIHENDTSRKETLHITKKPLKETYDWVQKRPTHVSKRHLWKRLLCITKRPVKDTYGWIQKRPIKLSKRDVCIDLKETCVAVVGALANAVDCILFAAVIAREQALAWHLVCMYVCMYVCVLCVCVRVCVGVYTWIGPCITPCIYECVYDCMCACVCVCVRLCMRVHVNRPLRDTLYSCM